LALVLLVGAGLMVQTFNRLLTINAGFNPNNLLTMRVALPASQYRTKVSMTGFYQRVLDRVETIGEVKAAGVSAVMGIAEGLYIQWRPEPRPGEPRHSIHAVSGHYFETLALPILQGRAIARQDGPDASGVVVVSETIARHYWPGTDPLGQRIKLGAARSPWLTVVGVSGHIKDWFRGQAIPAVRQKAIPS
jgi:hypothetical protein